jgi:hypothetical protein
MLVDVGAFFEGDTMVGNRPVDDGGKSYIRHVILSAARSFAALRMTCRIYLKPAHGKALFFFEKS